ncbi:tetratricopeptide repeat protein [Methyloceanibacter sp.]|uniref:tetratricopeptide repeat protein n=1 Tax=Methyloceanibacter sp. TaxID=1965321 RepID=UPI003D6D7BE6
MPRTIAALLSLFLLLAFSVGAEAASQQLLDGCAATEPKRAIAACTKIINSKKETKEDRAWAYSNRGVSYDNKGDLDRAFADYSEAIRLDPKFADAYRNRGEIWLTRGENDRAMSDLDAAIRLNPKDHGAHNSRGVANYFKGDLDSAIFEFGEAIKLSRLGLYYSNRGEAYIDQGKYEEANSDIASAIKLDPKLSNSFANRARLHGIKGENDLAIADFNKAIGLQADYALAFALRGETYQRTGDIARAKADFNAALAIPAKTSDDRKGQDKARSGLSSLNNRTPAPSNAVRQGLFGIQEAQDVCTFKKDDPDRTISVCTQAIERNPTALSFNERGAAYYTKGDHDRAIADYTRAIELNPKFAVAFSNRGVAYSATGKRDLARADFEKALSIDPNVQGARQSLAALDNPLTAQTQALLDNIAQMYKALGITPPSAAPSTQALLNAPQPAMQAPPAPTPGRPWARTESTYLNTAVNDKTALERSLADRPSASGVFGSTTYNAALAGQHGPVKQPEPVVPSYEGLEQSESTSPPPPAVQFTAVEPAKPAPVAQQSAPQYAAPSVAGQPQPVVPSDEGVEVEKPGLTPPPSPTVAAVEPAKPVAEATPAPPAPIATPVAPLGKRVALVIGNSAYQNTTPLPNPSNDASDVAAALKRLGFTTVIEEKDLDKRGMDDAFRRFAREMVDADAAMFFYAGHAMQWQGANYLMPVDAKLEDEADVPYEMAKLNDMIADMSRVKAVRIAVLDACRDNPLEDRLKRSISLTRGGGQTRGLARIEKAEGLVVAYSTDSGNVAEDGKGRNSPFTAALLEYIETPGLEVGVLFRRVMGNVKQATNGKQHPELSILLDSEFYFKPGS